ncbi:hypothetical protein NEFER03_0275 [Nematocida sp. LUAm3]|nr:hypothetical protein NEFER03_0275 [Nematocida sp. LUAm3]KAI5173728.1 hypothetical protein NEFER02_0244 [Nematocida sp. LUAm2]KAI5176950.1 hypothetical protein NEFER01_0275 [Nematocida sp. LUAm1]
MFIEIQEKIVECEMDDLRNIKIENNTLIVFHARYLRSIKISEREYDILVCYKRKKLFMRYHGEDEIEVEKDEEIEIIGKLVYLLGKKKFLCFYFKKINSTK